MKKGTISECMGLTDHDWDSTQELAQSIMKKEELISDALLKSANEIKSDEFGKGDWGISPFEKKLLVAAYVIGINHGRSQVLSEMSENPEMMISMMMLSQRKGKK